MSDLSTPSQIFDHRRNDAKCKYPLFFSESSTTFSLDHPPLRPGESLVIHRSDIHVPKTLTLAPSNFAPPPDFVFPNPINEYYDRMMKDPE